jgi:hypothetical protein
MIVNFIKSEMSACAGILFFLKAHGYQALIMLYKHTSRYTKEIAAGFYIFK